MSIITREKQQTKEKNNLIQDFVLFFQKKEQKGKNDWGKFVLPYKTQWKDIALSIEKEAVYKKINTIVYNSS